MFDWLISFMVPFPLVGFVELSSGIRSC